MMLYSVVISILSYILCVILFLSLSLFEFERLHHALSRVSIVFFFVAIDHIPHKQSKK